MSQQSAQPTKRSLQPFRLRSSADFRMVYERGLRIPGSLFVAFCLRRSASEDDRPRIGFTIPRAVGKANVRNRIRRRMRESVRARLEAIPPGWDFVFNPRRSVIAADFSALGRDIDKVLARCKP